MLTRVSILLMLSFVLGTIVFSRLDWCCSFSEGSCNRSEGSGFGILGMISLRNDFFLGCSGKVMVSKVI